MSEKKFMPPVFSPEENDDYVSWKNDIEVWKLLTETKPEKLGLSVYLALKGQAREIVRNLKPADIATAEGYEEVMKELDQVYLKDNTTQAFCAFKEFYEYKRTAGQNFSEFIVDYDQRYHKLEKYEMSLPQGVQGFFLLKAANLTVESEKLARATAQLEYKDMREKLSRIFGDPGVLEEKGKVPEVKEEVYYGNGYDKKKFRGGANRGRGGHDSGGWRAGIGRGIDSSGGNDGDGWRAGNGRGMTYNGSQRGSVSSGVYRGRGRGANSSGGRLRCFRCQSEDHFVRDCPVPANEEVHHVEEAHLSVHITLHSSQSSLQVESLGKGLLDSGCSSTVAGRIWYDEYLSTLSEGDRRNVKEAESKSVFRFGDGVETKSLMCASVPVLIGRHKFVVDMEIVPNEIPLLISKSVMKQMGMKLDFARDIAIVRGEEVRLICTSTGHYCFPLNLTHIEDHSVNFVLHLQCLNDMSQREMMNKALKLHRQFSHASKEKLKKLLHDGGCENQKFLKCINEVCDDCEICQKFRKPPLRPVVGFPLAHDFNEVVCMDLKELEHTKLWMLHLIDAATRYSGACLIRSKRAEVIINNVF